MTTTSGIAALLTGVLLAGATAFGVVYSQEKAGADPVQVTEVKYGR